eukprot:1194871-Prorocentrum_minimum.AAC.3
MQEGVNDWVPCGYIVVYWVVPTGESLRNGRNFSLAVPLVRMLWVRNPERQAILWGLGGILTVSSLLLRRKRGRAPQYDGLSGGWHPIRPLRTCALQLHHRCDDLCLVIVYACKNTCVVPYSALKIAAWRAVEADLGDQALFIDPVLSTAPVLPWQQIALYRTPFALTDTAGSHQVQ